MPFTLVHPVAVIPFSRAIGRRVPLSALMIGSMVPDVEYLLRGGTGTLGHTVAGLGLFALPVGLAIYLVYEYLMREPLVALMPDGLGRRLWGVAAPRRITNLVTLLIVAASIVFGAATHLLLDAFTHYNGWFVQRSELLQSVAIETGSIQLVYYKLLQYVSAPIGGGLLLLWGVQWYRRTPTRGIPRSRSIPRLRRRMIVGSILGCTTAVAVVTTLLQLRNTGIPLYAQVALVRGAMAGMSTAALMLLTYCILFRIFGAAIRGKQAPDAHPAASRDAVDEPASRPTLVSDAD